MRETARRSVGSFWLGACAFAVVAAAGSYVVDSLRFFRITPWIAQKLHQNERFLMPGIARSKRAELVFIGTSRTQNISHVDLSRAFGLESVRLSLSGGYPSELARLLEVALAHSPAKRVIIELSIFPDRLGQRNTAAEFPSALYRSDLLAYPYYLLSPLSAVMFFDSRKYGFDDLASYNAWFPARKDLFGPESVKKDACLTPRATLFKEPQQRARVIEAEYAAIFRKFPGVRFEFFFPPFHRWLYTPQNLADTLALHRGLWDMAARYENVRLHDFAAWDEVAGNARRFCDLGHYDLAADEALLAHIKSGAFESRTLDRAAFEARLGQYAADSIACPAPK